MRIFTTHMIQNIDSINSNFLELFLAGIKECQFNIIFANDTVV